MELRHLRYFLKIAATSSFTQAASALNITQPTLSHQIKQLEQEIGTPLFDRAGRRVRLTAQGTVFKTYAESALREIEQGLTALAELEGLVRGAVTIGVFRSFSSSLLPPVLAQFSRNHPEVKVLVRQVPHVEIERGLVEGSFDLAIAYTPIESKKIVAEKIFTEPLALVVGRSHPLFRQKKISLARLNGEPLILLSSEFPLRQQIDRCFAARGITPQIVMEMNSNEAILATVRSSALATICAARTLGDSSNLHAMNLADPELKRTTAILWRQDSYRSAAASVIAQMIKDAYTLPHAA
jgi:LysR family cyn operon transcriptional activator